MYEAEHEAFVREDATRALPKWNVPADKDVDRAFSCKFSSDDREHVRTAAKTAVENQDVDVTPGRDRQWPKVVPADRSARSRREGNHDDGSTNIQLLFLPRLALQAVTQPPAGASVHTYPAIETFEHAKCTRRA